MEDENSVQRLCGLQEPLNESRIANVALHTCSVFRVSNALRYLGLYQIGQDNVVAVVEQSLREHGSDHAAGAGDDNVLHVW